MPKSQPTTTTIPTATIENFSKEALIRRWAAVDSNDDVLETIQRAQLFPEKDRRYGLYPDDELTIDDVGVHISSSFIENLLRKAEYGTTESKFDPDEDPCASETKEQSDDITKNFEITPVQRFVASFMHPRTPYNGVLLYHGVGVGKTCAAIQAAEAYLDIYSTRKVIIVAPKNIQEGFKRTIFNIDDVNTGTGSMPNTSNQCTGTTYLKLTGTLYERDKKVIQNLVAKAVAQRYEFYGYIRFANEIAKTLKRAQQRRLSDEYTLAHAEADELRERFGYRMLIIDEAHNVRDIGASAGASADDEDIDTLEDKETEAGGKVLTSKLRRLVEDVEGIKLMLMTATPMFNSVREIVFLLNLLLLNDKKITIRDDQVFERDGKLKPTAESILAPLANAYVSFMRGENPRSFPVRLYPETADRVAAANYPKTPFNPKDEISPADIKAAEKTPLVLSNFPEGSAEAKQYQKITSIVLEKNGYGYNGVDTLIQYSNVVYPSVAKVNTIDDEEEEDDDSEEIVGATAEEGRFGAAGFKATFMKEGARYKTRAGNTDWLVLGALENHSPKMAKIMRSIRESAGVCFVYSRFIKSGALMMAFVLEAHGYTPYGADRPLLNEPNLYRNGRACAYCDRREPNHGPADEHGHDFTPAKYVLLTGDVGLSPNNAASIKAAASPGNKDGGLVKVVLGSQIASEGIDLKYVREVHVLDAWFHLNKTEQIIGRGIRFRSHCALAPADRNTTIYLHCGGLKSVESADLYCYRQALRKAALIGTVSRILKINAVDCNLRKGAVYISGLDRVPMTDSKGADRLVDVNDKPYTLLCDWLESCKPADMECATPVSIDTDKLDMSTYTTFHASYMESKIKDYIRLLFQKQAAYHESEFVNIMETRTEFSKTAIAIALRSIIGDRTFVVRHQTNGEGAYLDGYIIYRNSYYLFQPYQYDSLDIPIAVRVAPLPVKRDIYTPVRVEPVVIGARQRNPLDWDTLMMWIELVEAEDGEELTEQVDMMLQLYVTDPTTKLQDNARYEALADKVAMVLKFINDIPQDYKAAAAQVAREYFWDSWLTEAEQQGLAEGDDAGAQHRVVMDTVRATRYINPYSGVLEYYCEGKPCSEALKKLLEKNPDDAVRTGSVDTAVEGRAGPMYGFITYKLGAFKFKMAAPAKKGMPVAHGLVCETVSKSALIDDAFNAVDAYLQEELDIDLGYAGMKTHQNNSQLCTLLELQLRFMEHHKLGGLRWFYRPIEAYYSGHRGDAVKEAVAKKAAPRENKKARLIKGTTVPFQRKKIPGYKEATRMVEPDVKRVIKIKKKVVEEPVVEEVELVPVQAQAQEPVEPAQILRNVGPVNINPIPIVSGVAVEPGQVLKKRVVRIAKPKEEVVESAPALVQTQVVEQAKEEPKKITIRKIARQKEEVVESAPALAVAQVEEETLAQVKEQEQLPVQEQVQEEPKKITIRKIARPKEEVVEPAPVLAQVEEQAPAQVQEEPKKITIKKIARPKEDDEEQEIPESKPKFAVKKLTKSSETPEEKSASQEEEEDDNSGYL